MPFDGRPYAGRLGLIPPIYSHPQAPHVGNGLAQAQRISFQALRHRARVIGSTTYQVAARIGVFPPALSSSTWVDIASHSTYLPSYCSAIIGRLSGRIDTGQPTTISLRVVLTDGSNTDTGTASTVFMDAAGRVTTPFGSFSDTDRAAFSLWMPDDPANFTLDAVVAAADARVTPGPFGERTITVQAFALGDSGGGVPLSPGLVTCAWVAYG